MGYVGGKISKPVSIYDVQRALGTSETDLGSLCAHDNLNMWAKYKPIITDSTDTNKIDAVTLTQRANANYGISDIPMWNRIDYMLPFIFGDRNGHAPTVGDKNVYWSYRKPYGKGHGSPGDTDYKGDAPFRLTDFADPSSSNGYFQGAERPFTGIQATEYTYDSQGYFRINYGMGAQDNLTIKLNELNFGQQFSWGSMYFGVALCKVNNGQLSSNYYVTTQYESGSQGITDYNMNQTPTMGFWVNIYNNSLPDGVYKIYPIISSNIYHFASSQFGSSVKSICLLDPNDGGDTISIGTPVFELLLSMFRLYRKSLDLQFIYGELDIVNLNAVSTHYTALLEIFNASGSLIASRTFRPSAAISGGGGNVVLDLKTRWQQSSAAFDVLNDNNIQHADTARVTVTPTDSGLTNPQSTTMVCVVGDRS